MRFFLLKLKEQYQVLLIMGATIFFAFMIAGIVSLFFDIHQLMMNTELISSVYQVMGTIYAILLTFALWGVWQNFMAAENSVENEAYALLDLVYILETSQSWQHNNIRQVVLSYLTNVIEQWSSLKNFTNHVINFREYSNKVTMEIIQTVKNCVPVTESEDVLFQQAWTLLNRWLDARRTRILMARGNSAKALWPLLLTGACVLFAFHGLFVARTIGIWSALLFGTSLVIGLTFYLIFTLDCPFNGALSIDSEPFTLAIHVLTTPTE